MICTMPNWFSTHEYIAIWMEGIALIAILALDAWEFRRQGNERVKDEKEKERQHTETAAQLRASLDLVESAQKPCLVLSSSPRDHDDAIIGTVTPGNDGGTTIRCPGGDAQLENIGNGPAVNARCGLTPTKVASTDVRLDGYLATLMPGAKFLTPIPCKILAGSEWQIVFTYESLSGRRYETRIIVNNLVLTKVQFSHIP